MKNLIMHKLILVFLLLSIFIFPSCEDFFNPKQDILVKEDQIIQGLV